MTNKKMIEVTFLIDEKLLNHLIELKSQLKTRTIAETVLFSIKNITLEHFDDKWTNHLWNKSNIILHRIKYD